MSDKHRNVSGDLRTYFIHLRLADTEIMLHDYASEREARADVMVKVDDTAATGADVRSALVGKLCGLCGGTGRLIEHPRTREASECDECEGTGVDWERTVWNGIGKRIVRDLSRANGGLRGQRASGVL
jgi:hypothetical protein